MIVDLATLRHMASQYAVDEQPSNLKGPKSESSPPNDDGDMGDAKQALAAPEASMPSGRASDRRSFTLAEESPESSLPTSSQPKLRFSGAGVYGRPVRFSGDGRYQPGGSGELDAKSEQEWATEELDFEKLTASLRDHKS
ncbi:MAG: hypothetical protein AAFV36_04540 [Myxococcota bacterium]